LSGRMSIVSIRRLFATLVLATVTLSVYCYASEDGERRACHLPGDLVFVLDESGSIWGPAFQEQLTFVELVADTFDIGPDKTRIGVMTFASDTQVVFHLDAYDNRDQIKQAIRQITQRRGGTQTHRALAAMRLQMFSPEHSRSTAAHVAIVITDGESEEPADTAIEAALVHEQGINVIAIGVGPHVIMEELQLIASNEDLVFTAPTYAALQPLLTRLAWKACEVLTTTTTTTSTTTPAPAPMIAGCASRMPVDLVWSLPNEAGAAATESILQLVSLVAGDLDIGPTSVQVGVAPRTCSTEKPAIRLKDHDTVDGLRSALNDRHLAVTANIDKQLEYLRSQGFASRNGGRDNAAKLALVVVDRRPSNPEAMRRELTKVHRLGVKLIVIGVGQDVDADQLTALAANGGSLVRAESYAELGAMHVTLVQRICAAIRDTGLKQLRELLDFDMYGN